jgi:serine/threonine protein kinase
VAADALGAGQQWLERRFESICPKDFGQGMLFYAAKSLHAPRGFQRIWGTISEHHRRGSRLSAEERHALLNATAVTIFADPYSADQMDAAVNMIEFVNSNLKCAAPVLILATHTMCPESQQEVDEEAKFQTMVNIIGKGLDEAIVDEPEGIMLVWQVKSRTAHQTRLAAKLEESCIRPNNREDRRLESLKGTVHDIMWDYLRVRLCTKIPDIDWSLPLGGSPKQIKDYRLGDFLGEGTCGRVYKLLSHSGEFTGSVVKSVPKRLYHSATEFLESMEQVHVMMTLSTALPHPNITKFYEIFHSPTHLHFRLENGGTSDLYKYLKRRERHRISVPVQKTLAILSQAAAAVSHMHTTANIVHLDLKPENILIFEDENSIILKISDFDTARLEPKVPMFEHCGTFPFSAPEVLLDDAGYDPYAADIWSLGIIILEVLCYAGVLEKVLHLTIPPEDEHSRRRRRAAQKRFTARIRQYFSLSDAIGSLINGHMRSEVLGCMATSVSLLLEGMLNVHSEERAWDTQVVEALESVIASAEESTD